MPAPDASIDASIGASVDAPIAETLLPDLARVQVLFVNLYFCGTPDAWVLVDAGLPGSADRIVRAAAGRFGPDVPPQAIVLTHGHFDHVGALHDLVARWDVPVYAHPMELPYLTGRADYPPPDPMVGEGAMALLSWLYPRRGIDLGPRVRPLPEDGRVPHLPGWRWIHTPGHAPGHVSLFRDQDRTLVAGDAFVTVKQESLLAVAMQRQEVHGPPSYFTIDWPAARQSVEQLAALEPALAATGHGIPMEGPALAEGLATLTAQFDRLAVPEEGRYVRHPAVADEQGILYTPPPVVNLKVVAGLGVAAALATTAFLLRRSDGS